MTPLLLIGVAAGTAAATYFFDPDQGRRRRARLRDKATSVQTEVGRVVRDGRRDLANRTSSLAGRTRSMFGRSDPSNRVLAERVRAKMGRYVAHPGAVEVSATRGCVILTGSILSHEHHDFIAGIADVPGVQDIYDRLTVFERAEGISELQGGKRRRSERTALQGDWSPSTRLIAGAAGTVLTTNLLRGSLRGWLYAAVGAALLVRAATNKPLSVATPAESGGASASDEGSTGTAVHASTDATAAQHERV